jgi:hypothetical protein
MPVFNRSDVLVCALESLGAEPTCELLRLLRELIGYMVPDTDLADHLDSIAQAARDMFRGQTADSGSAPEIDQMIEQKPVE